MSTEGTPQPLTSISEMTPMPGESAQACPGIFRYLVAQYEKQLSPQNATELSPDQLAQRQKQVAEAQPLLDFFEDYFKANPPVQATAINKKVVMTLQNSARVQVGGEIEDVPLPGSMEPSTSIQI